MQAVSGKTCIFAKNNYMERKQVNRIKVVLAEKSITNKWLAEKLGRDQATISKWCTNAAQPPLETLIEISQCLNVDVKELIWLPQKESQE